LFSISFDSTVKREAMDECDWLNYQIWKIYRYIASTTDPGPTTWRLLHSGTHGLTLTLLFTTTTIIKRSKQQGDLHFTTNSTRPVVLSRQIRRDPRLNPTALTILTRVSRKHSREYVEYVGTKIGLNHARGHQRSCQPTLAPVSHREEVAAFGDPRANGDSTLNPAYRDAFPLRELQASQPTGGGNDCLFYTEYTEDKKIEKISKILNKYFRPRSHREEVAAFGDPRANGDSTLNPAYRDAFPLRVLQASQPTGDGNDCLFYTEYTEDVRSNGKCIKYFRPRSHREEVAAFGDPRANGDSTLIPRTEMPFRFGCFRLLSPLEMGETPLTEGSTVHTVGFRHLETRPVVSIFRYFKNQNAVLGFNRNDCLFYTEYTEDVRSNGKCIKYFRPRSHREEVAAFGDPRANGDSTLNPAYRDAFPLRVLQASQPTGDG
ncbi:hypothetical protein V1478_016522, partial [Vespula squamosa]